MPRASLAKAHRAYVSGREECVLIHGSETDGFVFDEARGRQVRVFVTLEFLLLRDVESLEQALVEVEQPKLLI